MLTILVVLGYIIFVALLLTGIVAALLGLPGTVIVWGSALLFSAITHWERVPWWVLVILGLMSVAAELSDSFVAAAGTRAGGGSGKTSLLVIVGTAVGAIVGGLVLSPVLSAFGLLSGPAGFVLGVVVPPLAGGMLGGFLAAYYYEKRSGKSSRDAARAGWGAFAGRLAAGLFKALIAGLMVSIIIYSIMATVPSGS
ncbi:MAG: DUF456 domain-containing protein [candidate division WS1 bacterium]|nr:DUF456 domain-containing protein [candidate division WS1 bacterium]